MAPADCQASRRGPRLAPFSPEPPARLGGEGLAPEIPRGRKREKRGEAKMRAQCPGAGAMPRPSNPLSSRCSPAVGKGWATSSCLGGGFPCLLAWGRMLQGRSAGRRRRRFARPLRREIWTPRRKMRARATQHLGRWALVFGVRFLFGFGLVRGSFYP